VSTIHATVSDLADRTAGEVITLRGKELPADAMVAAGRALLASSSVRLIPLLQGDAYAGAVERDAIAGADDGEPIAAYATHRTPVTTASTRVADAIAALGDDGGRRVVVLGDDRSTYVGLICLHRDGQRLCIDAECHIPGVGEGAG
jgi:CBS domain-containing protein